MKYNDYELVSLAQERNEEAINFIHQKYKPLIDKKAREKYSYLSKKGIELDDLKQEATIGFEEAINDYDQNNNALFYTFVNLCIDRQLNSYILKLNRNKYKILNEAISLDYELEDGNNSMIDLIPIEDNDPENSLLSKEKEQELYNLICNELTFFEKNVLDLKIQGFQYTEIGEILDKNSKSIDNTIQRIKSKVKKILNKDV